MLYYKLIISYYYIRQLNRACIGPWRALGATVRRLERRLQPFMRFPWACSTHKDKQT